MGAEHSPKQPSPQTDFFSVVDEAVKIAAEAAEKAAFKKIKPRPLRPSTQPKRGQIPLIMPQGISQEEKERDQRLRELQEEKNKQHSP
ncbi:MAG: hypothetical protein UR68_C0020G0038 [Candidatus Roizmanbacteria bacterium GW2011_GWA2_35_19]|uniref:Uncharacterized protein n=2 Tax=Candidatus Roizmaniibacteriota TaxID=1752723 RepID=A0A0G0BS23_9BACT|nr:MAG: hypothetical protein UR63_C0033G0001 [Candidatus Roizmanbacteria bacterium GW2011_GWC2_35_12]KKP72183.1 MAG: hypothetical protein UR68_C0020G0038 [Candidatus Roizmanbacteria bacterium GW2011_GWA2_35_19]